MNTIMEDEEFDNFLGRIRESASIKPDPYNKNYWVGYVGGLLDGDRINRHQFMRALNVIEIEISRGIRNRRSRRE
jgi:hypothetical protein